MVGRLRRRQPALRRARPPSAAAKDATVWVHDYQLQLVPQMLRELRPDLRIGFFLHIPFPPAELFQQLPWRRQILEGLLGADLVGFQLPGGAAELRPAGPPAGRATRPTATWSTCPTAAPCRAAAFPISIDYRGLRGAGPLRGGRRSAPRRSARRSATRRKVFLGIDRLDYTKGIYARLRAFAELIRDGELDVEDAVFVQVATPSRERVEQYRVLRDEIDRLVGRINGDLGRIGRPAISYLHSSYPREEMAALYRAADVMVVTPFRDGMNLVAKEYVACRYDDDGALVLSEFAGARRRAAAGLAGQPLRHQRHEGRAARRRSGRAEGPAAPDAGDAQDRQAGRRRRLGDGVPRRAGRRAPPARQEAQADPRPPEPHP